MQTLRNRINDLWDITTLSTNFSIIDLNRTPFERIEEEYKKVSDHNLEVIEDICTMLDKYSKNIPIYIYNNKYYINLNNKGLQIGIPFYDLSDECERYLQHYIVTSQGRVRYEKTSND